MPPGLGMLSASLHALVDFLRLDLELLAVAAEASPPLQVKAPSAAALGRWVKALPEAEKNVLLLRLLGGDDAHLRSVLLRRVRGLPPGQATSRSRTVGELLAAAEMRRSASAIRRAVMGRAWTERQFDLLTSPDGPDTVAARWIEQLSL